MNQAMIKALLRTQAYPEPTRSVQLIQTHVSFLFLTDEHVYKIKKPVDFGFLNFTTLDRRRFYCGEEVRLNRRLCPDIYLGVVEVRDSPEGPTVGGSGAVIDYAVKMKRLPAERMLDRLIETGKVSEEDMRRIGHVIGAFHLRAERSPNIGEYGTVAAIRRNWQENFEQLAPFTGETVSREDLRLIRDWVEQYLDEQMELFQARVAGGFIRDCDGDIHLENICLTDQVNIFDCIEFNDRFRYSDTAADMAFLVMDLEFHGRSDLVTPLVQEYTATTGDPDLMRLLGFYSTYRAVVRGKVESFRLRDPQIPGEEKEAARRKAAKYLHLARNYVLRSRLPLTLFVTCGITGTGKSTVAAALATELDLEIFTSDIVRKQLAGMPEVRHVYSQYGDGIYTEAFTESTYRQLMHLGKEALARGRSVLIDATFRRKSDRSIFRAVAGQSGARFFIIHTSCPEDTARQRLDERAEKKGGVSDGRWEIYHLQRQEFEPPGADEANLIFIDTTLPIDDILKHILRETGLV
ncbi:bifunctional aminoglycoside phosphotransferase/ATP-binding protein [Geobacter sp. DSM 9736]|uniref:bifunctional aminoglycoside phosphotransferase/ATP-binding protein n=1 Tax=Geobacter sp. DSM 9736 TaxID=1277350 RepID=UPI000B503542|nr:bifunctional aminoglycoside phosphotransferase/ATP-binding protein [Geobacter sp. DSM 9736]SNB46088.1 hypothetical protein SAMN06269301_1528 [Geobacter sp. DSM 9736]